MTALEFYFQDVLDEVQSISSVAREFIEPTSWVVLHQLQSTLASIRDSTGSRIERWGIEESLPLRTKVSRGCYQPDDKGEHNVFAEITSVWQIQRIAPPKRSMPARRFCLKGLASTRVRFWQEAVGGGKGHQLGMFRIELGGATAPGCHFHTQILGEADDGPFPKSLDVPRLPGFLTTPPAVIEFALSELFQDAWAKNALTKSPEMLRWVPIQQRRLGAVLQWHAGVIADAAGSPWARLKQAQPHRDLFLDAQGA